MKKITNIDQFLEKNFNENSSEYIVCEAKIMNSFLKRLADLGFKIVDVSDGEETYAYSDNNRFEILDTIFSVDESQIVMESNTNERFSLYIVLGNGDATPIADHSKLSEDLEKLIFSEFALSVKTHSEKLYELNWAGYEICVQ